MKYLKLFENYRVDKSEYPENVHIFSSREEQILKNLVGDYYLNFNIKKDDGYYYTKYSGLYNRFDNFNDLKDYIQFRVFIDKNDPNNLLEILKVSKLDMSFDNNKPIQWASENGHTEIVKLLLENPRVDPSVDNNLAIRISSEYGHTEIVKLLLADPRVDPSDYNNYSIRWASENGHTEIVKLLLADPRVDPSADSNWAIKISSVNGHKEIVKLLLNDPRVRAKLTSEEINKYRNEKY